MRLYYQEPAREWTEALPIGNGRQGGMLFGGIECERIQLNDDTLWSGPPDGWNNPEALERLPEARRLIEAGQYAEAEAVAKGMMGPYTQSYLPLGDLRIAIEHGNVANAYSRELHLGNGLASVEYRIGDVVYTREAFASYPDQAIVLRLRSSKPGMLNVHASLDSPLRHRTEIDGEQLILAGYAPERVAPSYYDSATPIVYGAADTTKAIRFAGRLGAATTDGAVETDHDGVHVYGASDIVFIFCSATSYPDGMDPGARAAENVAQAMQCDYESLRNRHLDDYQRLFARVNLDLGEDAEASELPTDRRIIERGGQDNGLVKLLFDYGRYLMIASSRPGTQPANLQGIWNQETRPPWSSNWTLNINTQMNYWPAENCGLAEMHEPLLELIERLAENGRETARIHYGAEGWTAHHNADIWGQTAPVGDYGHGDPVWALWPMSGAWLAQHSWEHYAFGLDESYLRKRAYPIMKGAALFGLDWLFERDGYLVTSPSTSPEHKFRYGQEGRLAGVSMASTMDMAILWDLFTNCIEAAEILDVDAEFRERLIEARGKLYPMRIGKHGQLQEWYEDFEDEDTEHRHVSHLFGVYPGRQLTEQATPELFAAARQSLERRGDGGTGWSLGWKVGLWARFGEGDRAHALLCNLLRMVKENEKENYHRGGVYANLFDAHPPFQIDGNFAASAGIAEMLLQSHQGFIQLLPALPSAWPAGSVTGLRARGGFELELAWADGAIQAAIVHARAGGSCAIRSESAFTVKQNGTDVAVQELSGGVRQFETEAGASYAIQFGVDPSVY